MRNKIDLNSDGVGNGWLVMVEGAATETRKREETLSISQVVGWCWVLGGVRVQPTPEY